MRRLIVFFLLMAGKLLAQNGTLTGTVVDAETNAPLPGAAVFIEVLQKGTYTDSLGRFELTEIPAGTWVLKASMTDYQSFEAFEQRIETGSQVLLIRLQPQQTEAVEVRAGPFAKPLDELSSTRSVGVEQIRSNPGGNQDISRVVQTLPGVSGSVGFRNDLIVRGGAPNENVFYLDGVEIPNINHFATQGSGGGPVGILNAIFIQDLQLQSSGFGAQYDNTLSSVLDFTLSPGNSERFQTRIQLGASESSLTFDTPIGNKVTALASVRRSYLQLLFQLIDLPFLPDYWDFQTKIQYTLNDRNTLTLVGIGAIDRFTKNDRDNVSPEEQYILDGLPVIRQNTYTAGLVWRHLTKKGYFTLAASRNWLENDFRIADLQDESRDANVFLSAEAENKLRFNATFKAGEWQVKYGAIVQYAQYDADNFSSFIRFNPVDSSSTPDTLRFTTDLGLVRYGLHVGVGRGFFADRLKLQVGLRADMNSFTTDGHNPINSLSPRLNLGFALTKTLTLNATTGIYYKLPAYTLLGFRDSTGREVNRNLDYIRSTHLAGGLEFRPFRTWVFSLEGFYKAYDNYPVSQETGLSLANTGGDFAVFGNEAVSSTGTGQTYGLEAFAQKRLTDRLYGLVSYTLFWSRFSGDSGEEIRSSWDNRHLVSVVGGYKFGKKRTWEAALRWRFLGGTPYTPFDTEASIASYLQRGEATLDYDQTNTEQTPVFSQVDVRLSKQWYFRKWSFEAFIDIQNALMTFNESPPTFTLQRTPDGTAFAQPYTPELITTDQTSFLPSIGLRAKF